MEFLEKVNEYASNPRLESVKLPQEDVKDIVDLQLENKSEVKDESSDIAKTSKFEDMIKSGEIQMEWTKVNTSNTCGCNNACFNSCFNVG